MGDGRLVKGGSSKTPLVPYQEEKGGAHVIRVKAPDPSTWPKGAIRLRIGAVTVDRAGKVEPAQTPYDHEGTL